MIELPIVIGAGAVIAFCLSTLCYEMRRSRCTSIACCGCKLERTLLDAEALALDARPVLQHI